MEEMEKGMQYTFDSFAVTKANRQAFEAAKRFAENENAKPLAVFGGTTTGKTHLLYAVKNTIKQNYPELTVHLTTTAKMQTKVIKREFHKRYPQGSSGSHLFLLYSKLHAALGSAYLYPIIRIGANTPHALCYHRNRKKTTSRE